MKVKPWQIAVIVIGFLVGGGFIAYTLLSSEGPDLVYVTHYIDVESGTIYRLDTRKHAIGVPGGDPVTGKVNLVRLTPKEKGAGWFVSERDLATIPMLDKGVKNVMIDEQSGELLTPPKTPINYPLK